MTWICTFPGSILTIPIELICTMQTNLGVPLQICAEIQTLIICWLDKNVALLC